MTSRILLLGVGGLSLELLDPLIHNGWLPNLEFLLGRGVVGPLISDLPPFAALEWSTLLSGEGPGTTGFLEGWRKGSGTYFPEIANLSALARRSSRFLLARSSREAALVGVPLPTDAGPLPSEESIQLFRWEEGRLAVRSLSVPSVNFPGPQESETPEGYLEGAVRRMISLSVSVARTVRESGARMVAVHFAGLDRILSRFHKDIVSALLGRNDRGLEALLRQFFRVFDDVLGTVIEITRRTDSLIILASPHGFVPARRVINLNAFLVSRGYLALRPEAVGELLLREVAAPVLRAMKLERGRVRKILGRPALQDVVDRTGSLLSSEIGLFDWSRTRAFALSRTGITLNVKGVESQGTVNPGPEERALGEEIREALLTLADPATGQSPLREVSWREELFGGPGLPELPHLVVHGHDPGYLFEDWRKASPSAPIFADPCDRTGSPGGPGFYCISGSGSFSSSAGNRRLALPRLRTLPEISAMIATVLDGELSSGPEVLSQLS